MYKIITIAREYGSGGRQIAQRVAEKLQMIYYDNEIIDLAAMELGIDVAAIRSLSEEKTMVEYNRSFKECLDLGMTCRAYSSELKNGFPVIKKEISVCL